METASKNDLKKLFYKKLLLLLYHSMGLVFRRNVVKENAY